MKTFAAAAALGLFATAAANAQIPNPIDGNGGFTFLAFDATSSYSQYIGVNYQDFDPNTGGQIFDLPNFDGFFDDLGLIEWSVVAGDNLPAPGSFQGQGFYTTGTARNLNGPAINTLTSALVQYTNDVNIACPDTTFCLTDSNAEPSYAGNIADLQSPQQVDNGASFGQEIGMVLVTQSTNPASFDLEELPFNWVLESTGDGFQLRYGEAQVIPVPAAFWLMISGVAGLFGIRRRS